MQWNSLELYFPSNFDLDDGLTENDPDEKHGREKSMVNAFRQPVSKLYAMFVQSVIPIFDRFNTLLQTEEALIHSLYHSTLHLYRSLFSRFLLPEVISESDDVLGIDLVVPDVFKDFNSISIQTMTKQYSM